MPKIDWASIWTWFFKGATSIILEVAVIIVGNLQGYCTSFHLPCWAYGIIGSIVLFMVLLAIVQFIWTRTEKIIQKYRLGERISEWINNPKLNYSYKLNDKGELLLYLKSCPMNKNAHLKLQVETVIPLSATNAEKNSIQTAMAYVDDKRIFDDEIRPNDLMVIQITKKMDDGRMVLFFRWSGRWVLLYSGKYRYRFDGSGVHKKRKFYDFGKEIRFELDKNGTLNYDKEN